MEPFVYNALPGRIVFGRGTLAMVADEVAALGRGRAFVLSTPQQADVGDALARQLGEMCVGTFAGAAMHTPVDVTARAIAAVTAAGADCLVAIGGGSTTGLGKAIALRTDLPQIVLPTSYAGSEMTPVVGQTSGGIKTTQSSPKILPEIVIYDVDLTLTLPVGLTVTSGLNAIAHAGRHPSQGLCRQARDAARVGKRLAEDPGTDRPGGSPRRLGDVLTRAP